MKFFSGFCFDGESELFSEYIEYNDFCVAGFSYGAIKAFEYTSTCRDRIDKLQLFSPAFFQDKSDKFKRLQTISFSKNQDRYIQNFFDKVKYPSNLNIEKYFKKSSIEDLERLLNYEWDANKLEKITKQGVQIEVYLGGKDKIINPNSTLEFFSPYTNLYFIKNTGHVLS